MDEKYTDLAVRLQEVDSRSRSNEHRIDTMEEDINKLQETQITLVKLAEGVDRMAEQLVDMKKDIRDVKSGQSQLNEKVTVLENRPAKEVKKRWDTVYDKILWVLAGGIAVGLLSAVLPNIPW